ncbi:MAG TPA: electron transfer flavoprotein-ubiquinone oxidoreductase [Candidatus Acidoferrales bacterium]|nr:electron transfer flavoprotein-ubiquinone oxidoreductase [Candidatus Acidoferrales bacterium]
MSPERERLDADVLIVGAGPAGLACALHLARLIRQHNESGGQPELSTENIYVLEKGREIGAHQLSGAVLDPCGLAELVPDFATSAPLDAQVTDDAAYFLTRNRAWKLPITPPPLRNHGNYIVSLNRLVKWLGGLVEQAGVNVFTQFAGAQLIDEGGAIAGVITEDKGVDKDGKPKDNFTPGYELRAKVTVLAEGPRGSLTKHLVAGKNLDGFNPQVYSIGVKELWEVLPDRINPGWVAHTLGWPLDSSMYGGGWIYGMRENRVSLGLVTGLEYHDPRFDPHEAFQQFKTHPFVRRILQGGKLIRYGAKTIPVGGWYSIPKTSLDGCLIIGDSASLLNSQRLKGIHMAIKSGMLAAETIVDAMRANDFSGAKLSAFRRKIDEGWVGRELRSVRNFHQSFQHGLWPGLAQAALQFVTAGRGLIDPMRMPAGYTQYHKIDGAGPAPPRFKGDGVLTFDRLTDVYHSGTRHEEDQPCHLHVLDTNICVNRCIFEYGSPCQYFCPAAVYEMVEEKGVRRLKINFSNCVHCKTCDIADPYQIIDWVPPEGGGGPNYEGM